MSVSRRRSSYGRRQDVPLLLKGISVYIYIAWPSVGVWPFLYVLLSWVLLDRWRTLNLHLLGSLEGALLRCTLGANCRGCSALAVPRSTCPWSVREAVQTL